MRVRIPSIIEEQVVHTVEQGACRYWTKVPLKAWTLPNCFSGALNPFLNHRHR